MLHRTIATLAEILRPEPALSKSRVETLCMIVIGMISARTVISAISPANVLVRRCRCWSVFLAPTARGIWRLTEPNGRPGGSR